MSAVYNAPPIDRYQIDDWGKVGVLKTLSLMNAYSRFEIF
jgi:hypothetical protein